LKEVRELEKLVAQESGEFGGTGGGAGRAPQVVMVQPHVSVSVVSGAGGTGALPTVEQVQFPDGAPAGYIEAAEAEILDGDPGNSTRDERIDRGDESH